MNHTQAANLGSENAALPLVPIECVDSALQQLRRSYPPYPPTNSTASRAYEHLDAANLSAPSHYRVKADNASAADRVWAWDFVWNFANHQPVPPYSAFLAGPQLRERVGRLFADDLRLYRATCRQRWLQGSSQCMAMCDAGGWRGRARAA